MNNPLFPWAIAAAAQQAALLPNANELLLPANAAAAVQARQMAAAALQFPHLFQLQATAPSISQQSAAAAAAKNYTQQLQLLAQMQQQQQQQQVNFQEDFLKLKFKTNMVVVVVPMRARFSKPI